MTSGCAPAPLKSRLSCAVLVSVVSNGLLFPQCLRVNSTAYIATLDTVDKRWIEEVTLERLYVYQQNKGYFHDHLAF